MIRFAFIMLIGALVAFPANAGLGKHRGGGGVPSPLTDEEFVGPFPSWMCARTAASGTCGTAAASFCNAAGNGVADDTTAIQGCLTSLGSATPVVYLPCGTYNISTTLTLSAKNSVVVIGQDNSTASGRCTTTLKWTGASGGTLLRVNGSLFSQLSRITFDGNNLANILVDQNWDGSTGSFDASNEYVDDVFKNGNDSTTSYGLRCGASGSGCSEVNLVRGNFSNLGFGVATCNANALDMMIWYSSFTNLKVAVTNGTNTILMSVGCSGGGYHVEGSVFQNSTLYDFFAESSVNMNVLDSYSSGSNQFASITNTTFQRDTIVNTTVPGAISSNGQIVLLDNTIENTNSSTPYVNGVRALSIGNRYTNASPFSLSVPVYASGDTTISYAPPGPPILPGTAPNNSRTIYEASPSGSGTTCSFASPCAVQTAICKASNGAGSTFSGSCSGSPDGLKNVAHLRAGSYSSSATILIPASSNAQVIGDGWNTILAAASANPLLAISGPSKVTLRGLHITGGTSNDGVHVSGADQAGAYVYFRGERLGSSGAALVLSGLSNALVQADDFQYPFNTGSYDITQSGSNHFNQFFGTGGRFSLSGGANTTFVGGWFEDNGSFSPTSTISGTGSFIHSTALMGFQPTADAFDLTNFTGTFAMLNTPVLPNTCPYTSFVVNATGSGTGAIIIEAIDNFPDPYSSALANTAGSTVKQLGNIAATAVSGGNCTTVQGTTDSPNPITSGDLSVIASALSYFRSTAPLLPNGTAPGLTAIEVYDVQAESFANAIQVAP